MKKLFFALLLAAATAQLAAAQTADSAQAGRWQIGVTGSPDYSYRSLVATAGNADARYLKSRRDTNENARAGFTVGLSARRYFSRHFGLTVGLQFAQRQFGSRIDADAFEADQFDPGTGTSTPGKSYRLRVWDKYSYLEVPVGLTFRSNERRRLALVATAGLSVNYLISARYNYVVESENPQRSGSGKLIEDLNSFNLSAFASAGMEWRACPRLYLSASPVFRYGLVSVADAPLKGYLWAAGLQLGVMCKL